MLLHHGLKVTNLSIVLSLDEQRMRAQLSRKLAVSRLLRRLCLRLNVKVI